MIETYLCAVSPVRGRQVGFLWVCDIPDVVFFIFAQFQFSIWTGTAVWDSVGTKERFETWLPFKLPRGPLATSMGWNNIWSNIFMHLYFHWLLETLMLWNYEDLKICSRFIPCLNEITSPKMVHFIQSYNKVWAHVSNAKQGRTGNKQGYPANITGEKSNMFRIHAIWSRYNELRRQDAWCRRRSL